MPIILKSTYKCPKYLFNGHIQTILPSLFRKVKNVNFVFNKIDTPDDDFLTIAWLKATTTNTKLVIISHGLEGQIDNQYVKGMARAVNRAGYDVLAWNYRGCGGELNRKIYAYHSGATHDLDFIVNYALSQNQYEEIILIGFSLGGNLTLKYAGEKERYLSKNIKKIVAISTPCNLAATSEHLTKGFNKVYSRSFLLSLLAVLRKRAKLHPEIDLSNIKKVRTLTDYDEVFTAPIHGFRSAKDYYARCSCEQFIPHINIPTLIINAKNDPFFPLAAYPIDVAKVHKKVFLEMPQDGGHVGFYTPNSEIWWSEARAVEFITASI